VCECGSPVFIKKSGECKTCYHRRYYTEKIATKPKPVRPKAAAPKPEPLPGDLAREVNDMLVEALREHRLGVARASAANKRLTQPELVRREKALYRRRKRAELRAADAEYRARPEVRRRRSETSRAWRVAHPYVEKLTREEKAEKNRLYREANRLQIAEYQARYRAERRLPKGIRLCLICKDIYYSSGLCRSHYQAKWRAERKSTHGASVHTTSHA
jgi:hypothetical protein